MQPTVRTYLSCLALPSRMRSDRSLFNWDPPGCDEEPFAKPRVYRREQTVEGRSRGKYPR